MRKRRRFGWLFLVSILGFSVSGMMFFTRARFLLPSTVALVFVLSLLASITSLIEFFSIAALSWWRGKRERVSAGPEIEKKELETKRLRAKLAKSKEIKNGESA